MELTSEKEKNYQFYNLCQLDTKELEALLQLGMEKIVSNDSETDFALLLMDIIEKRIEEDRPDVLCDVDAAWESFKKYYLPHINCSQSIYDWGAEDDEYSQ